MDSFPLAIIDINDLAEMNEVYSAMIPDPKPARAAFEVGNLPVTLVHSYHILSLCSDGQADELLFPV